MPLAGPGVWEPPRDPDGAIAVLREAVAAGVNHIDTADFYDPHVTNQIMRVELIYAQELSNCLPLSPFSSRPSGAVRASCFVFSSS